jgi:hypothetical protein
VVGDLGALDDLGVGEDDPGVAQLGDGDVAFDPGASHLDPPQPPSGPDDVRHSTDVTAHTEPAAALRISTS